MVDGRCDASLAAANSRTASSPRKFGDILYCGINKADKTNHRLFEMQHEIVLTQPLSFQALDSAVKDHATKKNNDLGSDKLRPYIVTNEQVDIGRKGATTAKWRAVVIEPDSTLSFARGSDESPDEKKDSFTYSTARLDIQWPIYPIQKVEVVLSFQIHEHLRESLQRP